MEEREESSALAIEALRTAPPVPQFLVPLDYIFADHFRQRTLCRILDELAGEAVFDRAKAAAALAFLKVDFGAHIRDEEEDLFPLLRRRAMADDGLDDLLVELSQEHAADRLDAENIIEGLSAALSSQDPSLGPQKLRDLLRRFAANERHHLIVENAIVLPLARSRLTSRDLRNLGHRMAARRGIECPEPESRPAG